MRIVIKINVYLACDLGVLPLIISSYSILFHYLIVVYSPFYSILFYVVLRLDFIGFLIILYKQHQTKIILLTKGKNQLFTHFIKTAKKLY